MKTVCPIDKVIMGFDVSHWQPNINWQSAKDYGASFVFIKASEFKADPDFKKNWDAAKKVGIIRGAYHFFHPGKDPIEQAKLFVSTVGLLNNNDLPCVMDWEVTDGIPNEGGIENGLAFLNYVERATGKVPIIYSGPYFMQSLGAPASLERYPLWVAHYGPKCPLVPSPWKNWTFWQKTSSGHITGVGQCDVDVFNGSLEDLMLFAHNNGGSKNES